MRRCPSWSAASLAALTLVSACGAPSELGVTATVDRVTTIAILRAAPSSVGLEAGFFGELRSSGWVEGRNLTVLARERDEAYPDPEEAATAVGRWRQQGVELFVALSSTGARIVMQEVPDAPVLFLSNDPSAVGLIENEQQPEGSATGVSFRVPADRTLDLAIRSIPDLDTVGILYQIGDPTSAVHRGAIEAAAAQLGIEFVATGWERPDDVTSAVAKLAELGADAVVLSNSPGIVGMLEQLEAGSREHRLAVVANTSVVPWALLAVFPDPEELGRQLARQTARILSGSSPSAVPVEDPRSILVRVNLATAGQLGIAVPEEVLREATEVVPR